jgi:hypothetical protein
MESGKSSCGLIRVSGQDRQLRLDTVIENRSGEVVALDIMSYKVGEHRSRVRVLDMMLDNRRDKDLHYTIGLKLR